MHTKMIMDSLPSLAFCVRMHSRSFTTRLRENIGLGSQDL